MPLRATVCPFLVLLRAFWSAAIYRRFPFQSWVTKATARWIFNGSREHESGDEPPQSKIWLLRRRIGLLQTSALTPVSEATLPLAAKAALTAETTFAFTPEAALTTLAFTTALHPRSPRLEGRCQFLQVQRAVPVRVVVLDHHRSNLSRFRWTAFSLSTSTFTLSTSTLTAASTFSLSTAALTASAFAFSAASSTLGQHHRRHSGNRGSRCASGEQFA